MGSKGFFGLSKRRVAAIAAFMVCVAAPAMADIITPPFFLPQLGIVNDTSPLTGVQIFAFNLATNLIILSLVLHVLKIDVRKVWKRVAAAGLVGTVIGLVIDVISLIFGAFASYIAQFLVSASLLFFLYLAMAMWVIKVKGDKTFTVAILMALLTNPIWFTIVGSYFFYPDYEYMGGGSAGKYRQTIPYITDSECNSTHTTVWVKNGGSEDSSEVYVNITTMNHPEYGWVSGTIPTIKADETERVVIERGIFTGAVGYFHIRATTYGGSGSGTVYCWE
jgi:hypothetical protein